MGRWPFQSQADVWSERGRQTASPCSHLGLGLGPLGAGPPRGRPPVAAPIRFLPIKQPVFLLVGPRGESGKKTRGWRQGAWAPPQTGHDVSEMCVPCRAACTQGVGTGEARQPLGYGAPRVSTKTNVRCKKLTSVKGLRWKNIKLEDGWVLVTGFPFGLGLQQLGQCGAQLSLRPRPHPGTWGKARTWSL